MSTFLPVQATRSARACLLVCLWTQVGTARSGSQRILWWGDIGSLRPRGTHDLGGDTRVIRPGRCRA